MTDDLERLRKEAIEEDRCFSKSRLRDEFRMKPKPDAEAVKFYKNEFGKKFPVYRIADCEPMRQVKSPRSARQTQVAKKLALLSKLESRAAKAGKVAAGWLSDDLFVLDTETTGLSENDQVIEICICDKWGKIHVDQRVCPSVPIDPGAEAVHGITIESLESCPKWPDIIESIKTLISGGTVVTFNADFDMSMLRRTCQAFGVDDGWLDTINIKCAMALAVQAYGATNRYGTISLADATWKAGVSWSGDAHSAKSDTLATLDLITALYRCYFDPMAELTAMGTEVSGGGHSDAAVPGSAGLHPVRPMERKKGRPCN